MVAPSSLLYWTSSSSTATTSTTTSMDGSTEKSCFNGRGGEQQMRRTTTTSTTTTTTTRGSSRNKSGKVLAKKPPQRGLGVAQLERLRIQERWKKMTEFDAGGTTTTQSQQLMKQFPYHQFPFQEQQNLVSSVPMIAAAGFAFQEQQICNLSPLTPPPPPPPPPANFVFNPYRSGGSSGVRSVFSDHHVQFQVGNGNHHPFESVTKELSSSQKSTHCLYDQCDVCLKKKRMSNGENLGFEEEGGGGRSSAAAQYLERKSFVDGSDFLGLDLGRNWNTINGDGGNQIRRSSYASGITTTINDDQEEVEVVAIHRKGKISTGGGGGGSSSSSVLMEYDFFPRKGAAASSRSSSTRSSSSSRSSVMIKKEGVSLFGDQGSVGESATSSATTNLLDLSLKLSC